MYLSVYVCVHLHVDASAYVYNFSTCVHCKLVCIVCGNRYRCVTNVYIL